MKRPQVSSHSIPSSSGGAIGAHVFKPYTDATDAASRPVVIRGTIVLVHPWSALGGGEHNTIGLASRITAGRGGGRRRQWRAVTFALESDPAWRGGPLWGILLNHSHEVGQIVDVVDWVRETYRRRTPSSSSLSSDGGGGGDGDGGGDIVLLGSSAGAPMAGTAMARLSNDGEDALSAYVAVGYTFGNLASLAFGRHFAHVVANSSSSTAPRLFVMGERDEFTSVDQLERMAKRMRGEEGANGGGVVDVEIVPGVGHFELESPGYDELVARTVLDWLDKIPA